MNSKTKFVAALALAAALMATPLIACTGNGDGGSGSNESGSGEATQTDGTDTSSWKTLADAFAVADESKSSGYDETNYITVLTGGDRYYRVIAEADTDVLAQTDELDFFDEDYNKKYNAIVGSLNIKSVEDITDQLITENDPAYVGKTGQELVDDGFVFVGYMGYGGDETYATFDKGYFEYEFTFDVTVTDDMDEGAAIMDVASTAVQMSSTSDEATNPELVK